MAFDWSLKNIVIAAFFSIVLVTILNLFIHQIYPETGILKTGTAIILLAVSVAFTLAFVYASDKKVTRDEVYMFLLIIGLLIAIWYVTKTYIPQIFSLVPSSTKEIFSAILP